jgi:hypothetical protein
MKKIKKVIIDFNKIENILDKKTSIIELDCLLKDNDFNNILNFLVNNDYKVFINDNLNIKNISIVYHNLCNFIYINYKDNKIPKKINHSLLNKNIEKIKLTSTDYIYSKVKKDIEEEELEIKKLKNYIVILKDDNERFNNFIINILKYCSSDMNFLNLPRYKNIILLEYLKNIDLFSLMFEKIESQKKDLKKFLFLNIIDDIFKDLIEKHQNYTEEGSYSKGIFVKSYFDTLIKYYKSKNILTKTDILNEIKKYPNVYNYYLNNDPFLSILKLVNKKDEIIEDRIINNYNNSETDSINYLKIFIKQLQKKYNDDVLVFDKIKERFSKMYDFIISRRLLPNLMLLFEPNLEFIKYITISYMPNQETESDREKLITKYIKFLDNNRISIEEIKEKHENIFYFININDFHCQLFVEAYNKISDDILMFFKKNYKNIYTYYLYNDLILLDFNEIFDKIKQDEIFLKSFNDNDDLKFLVLKKYQSKIPFSNDLVENGINTSEGALSYLYFYRKKLPQRLEQLVNSQKTYKTIYETFLKRSKMFFNDYYSYEDFFEYFYNERLYEPDN